MAFDIEWYLAFVVDDTVAFDPEVHNVRDTELLAFTFAQREAEFAELRLTTMNKISGSNNWAMGLLRPLQKKWAWFSWAVAGGTPAPLALLRLVGVPSDVLDSIVVVEFSARPSDFNAQKAALNTTLRVAPYWLDWLVDANKRADMDIILDTYAGYWYTDPVTLDVSLTDLLLGEGGTAVFTGSQHDFDQMKFTPGEPPLTAVTVEADLLWTVRGVGTASMSLSSSSYTLKKDAYPQVGGTMGNGWKVLAANIVQAGDYTVKTAQYVSGYNIKWWDGDQSQLNVTQSDDSVSGGGLGLPRIVTTDTSNSTYAQNDPDDPNMPELTGWSVTQEWSEGIVPLYDVSAAYSLSYDAQRPYTEHVTLTLTADVQPLVTLPGEDEEMRIDDLNTTDLSEPINGVAPIGDPRRRSFVTQDNGLDTIRHMILLARAHLRKRARAVEITFSPFLDRIGELKLNKNAQVFDWRIPGGNAIGKIISFSVTLTPSQDGGEPTIDASCTIGCAIGNGGSVTPVTGTEEYVDDDYIDQSEDYQEYQGQVLVFNDDVGFTPPPFAPDDDGFDFINGVVGDIFEIQPSTTMTATEQASQLRDQAPGWSAPALFQSGVPLFPGEPTPQQQREKMVQDRDQAFSTSLSQMETEISFKLKDLSKAFTTQVPISVQPLPIPKMIDLGAV